MRLDIMQSIEDYMFPEEGPETSDIIFVPGNVFPQMAQLAARLYHQGFAPFVMPSGRCAAGLEAFPGPAVQREKYSGCYQSEWEFLRDVLLAEGVPAEAVLKEDQATFTWENALFSRKETDRLGLKVHSAILCCKTTHARRCLLYYRQAFPDTVFHVCTADPEGINRTNWLTDSENIHAVMSELERIIAQFSLLM